MSRQQYDNYDEAPDQTERQQGYSQQGYGHGYPGDRPPADGGVYREPDGRRRNDPSAVRRPSPAQGQRQGGTGAPQPSGSPAPAQKRPANAGGRPGRPRRPAGKPAQRPSGERAASENAVPTKSGKFLRFYKKFAIVVIILGIIYITGNVIFLYYRGALWFNEPRKRDYPVRGAVVTSALGTVDWAEFQYQPLTFAYVRASRGTKYIDEQYAANREGIDGSKLWAGFYHEFDFTLDGEEQAEHFIRTVGDLDGELRPAVRLETYGVYNIRMRSAEKVKDQLEKYLKRIKKEYGRRAVIMCDDDCYDKYVKPYFSDQTLWIIDHYSEPDEDSEWAIWEFNPRVRSVGYEKKDEYYSVVVYRLGKDISNFRKNFEIGYEE